VDHPRADASDDSDEMIGDASTDNDAAMSQGIRPVDLFPVVVGNRWTYEVREFMDADPSCPDGQYVSEIGAAPAPVGGRTSFVFESYCVGIRILSINGPDIDVAAVAAENWYPYLTGPVEEGAEFSYAGTSFKIRWSYVGHVTVEAGEFDGCWNAVDNLYSNVLTYCPGVGLVRSHGVSLGVNAELVAYHVVPFE
jgi:hypothetical protein